MKKIFSIMAILAITGFLCCHAQQPDYSDSKRPKPEDRLFVSEAVENEIQQIAAKISDPKLRWMFINCYPNTLDTTVHYQKDKNAEDDTFVITGDIAAMWLRDSAAQIWPYMSLINQDPALQAMVRGLILRQFSCIQLDPYANAFYKDPVKGEWADDKTLMLPGVHERKWEIDSLCYPIRLAFRYWQETGDVSIFDHRWLTTIDLILTTFKQQQRKDGHGPYTFMRNSLWPHETLENSGRGNPCKLTGLIASAFRPSDDATIFLYLIPSNFFAVKSLEQAAEILEKVNSDNLRSRQCKELAHEVKTALKKYAVVKHEKYGKIYAYEVDGFGGRVLMDDANVPSLLSMAYLGIVDSDNKTYLRTRRFVLSEDNPYFFKGNCIEGIGGPHIGYDMVWPMSIMMRAFTSKDKDEILHCLDMIKNSDNNTGFIHEAIHKDNPAIYTRDWFAWQNSLFGELIVKLVRQGYKL